MRNNETGEFELVVGNRQLLSGFFIVVLLFAVAFAMGYVVGQNSPRSAKASETASASPPVSLTPADSRPQPASPAQPTATEGTSAVPAASGEAPPQSATQPAQGQPAAAPAPIPAAPEAAPGSYWQVMAVPQVDAEVVARALKDKGFPASLSPGPNNLVRVLVGPYSDAQQLGKAKADLENAGMRPIRK
jgi:cell division septation protein DedD